MEAHVADVDANLEAAEPRRRRQAASEYAGSASS
jgi:hypothetical protein